jgi:hypothetical protein
MESSAPVPRPGPRQSAFLALVVLAGSGLLLALTLLGSPRKRRGEEPNFSPPATAVTDNPTKGEPKWERS